MDLGPLAGLVGGREGGGEVPQETVQHVGLVLHRDTVRELSKHIWLSSLERRDLKYAVERVTISVLVGGGSPPCWSKGTFKWLKSWSNKPKPVNKCLNYSSMQTLV